MQRHIAQREYRASANNHGLQAPNREHNLRTYFAPTGIRVHDRTRSDSPELLELNLVGVGRGETLAQVGPGEVTSDGARVEIKRPGLIEWYENSPAGLEQGVTLMEQPAGEGPLVVELLIRGARASLGEDQVNFATPTGRQLSYAKLVVLDARGRALEAHFELPQPSRLRLVVDDDKAVYPVVIDPLLTATADAQLESDQTNTNLGVSVAAAGDVNDDGYADVIVGAYRYDAGEIDEGAAFVFLGSADGIVANGNPLNADAQLESNQGDGWLGWSVAGAGDVNGDGYADVIVGAYRYFFPTTVIEVGAAFIYLGSASGIVARGNPSNANTNFLGGRINAWLGYSVAGAGDIDDDGYADVIVGAPNYDVSTIRPEVSKRTGAAFIFYGTASGIPNGSSETADTKLKAPDGSNVKLGTFFGWSVAGAGDVDDDGYADVIIGAPFYEFPTPQGAPKELNEGVAFVYLGSAGGIADGGPNAADTQLQSNQASAYLGHSVAEAGDVNGDGYSDVIVGAVLYDAGEIDEGAAFVFHGGAAGIADGDPSTAATQIESDQETAKLGQSVAGAGDINGDGYADVIVGAYRYDAGENEEGAAFLYLGSASGIVANGNPANADVQLESNQEWAWLGYSVAGAGDVNDDGVPDVIVGAPSYNAGQIKEGAAFVFLSDPSLVILPEPTAIVGLAAGVACLAIFARLRRRRWDRAI
ncbi:MAG: FG-GAP repeat protein [Deltaproteobacteria bacterium]|nr:FG-GAP repeat protein [Deltaproteobacteria bacterium]